MCRHVLVKRVEQRTAVRSSGSEDDTRRKEKEEKEGEGTQNQPLAMAAANLRRKGTAGD